MEENDEIYQVFNKKTGKWSLFPSMNIKRERFVSLVREMAECYRVYVFGGADKNIRNLDSCEYIDIGATGWTPLKQTMRFPRRATSIALLDSNTAVLCGGYTMGEITSHCEMFNLETHKFSSFPRLNKARHIHGSVSYKGTVVVIGGRDLFKDYESCERFNQAKNEWESFAPLNKPRSEFGVAVIKDEIFVVGGKEQGNSIEIFNGVSWSITNLSFLNANYGCSAISFNKMLIIIDGYNKKAHCYHPGTNTLLNFPMIKNPCDRHVLLSF